MTRGRGQVAGWIKRQAADLLADLDATNGRPDRSLLERLRGAERNLRLRPQRGLDLEARIERVRRIAHAAGLDQLHADQSTTHGPGGPTP